LTTGNPDFLKELIKVDSFKETGLLPNFVKCNRKINPIKKFEPKRIFIDVCCFLDSVQLRYCDDGYPLWYGSTVLINKIIKKDFIGIISQQTIDIALSAVSNRCEKSNTDGSESAKNILIYKKHFYVESLTDDEFHKAFDLSPKLGISLEDAIQLKCAKKCNADTFITRDIHLLEQKFLESGIQVLKPENIVGFPPNYLFCKKYQIEKQPQYLQDKLKNFFKSYPFPTTEESPMD